jgi:trk system potassium uptake protein TrkH
MQYLSIFKALGVIILVIAAGLLIPTIYGFIIKSSDTSAFFFSFAISSILGTILAFFPKSKYELKYRDGFALVSFGWLSAGLFGSLPFYLSGSTHLFVDAYFESISGFTTTGASIFSDIEGLSAPILLWRSLTQWFGGMGIIVLSLAILPYLDLGGMSIFQAEVPGPTAEKLTPRIQDTAKVLWLVYFLMTVVLGISLWVAGMNFFDSLNHSFTTMSTGGFSTKNSSISSFNSPTIEWILTLFMILAGINFALHYRFLFRGFKIKHYLQDSELSFYFLIITLAIISISSVILWNSDTSLKDTIRDVSFTVASIITTTGFGTADYLLWPIFGQFLLLFLMLVGGCAGSTSGGIKSVRIMLVFKYIYVEMLKLLHPNLVRMVKMRHTVVDRPVLANILSFIFVYTTVMIVSILLVSLETPGMMTSIGSVVASLSNIGPGFGSVGPTSNYAHLGVFSKWVLSLDMVMGRLEILTILILFLPQTWRK